MMNLQGGPFGRGPLSVDIKLKDPPQYILHILKRNSYFLLMFIKGSPRPEEPSCTLPQIDH